MAKSVKVAYKVCATEGCSCCQQWTHCSVLADWPRYFGTSETARMGSYALKDISKPVVISEYRLIESIPENLQGSLPSIEQIEAELSE